MGNRQNYNVKIGKIIMKWKWLLTAGYHQQNFRWRQPAVQPKFLLVKAGKMK